MTVAIEMFVENDVSDLINKLGYNTCYLYNFGWVADFKKFVTSLFKSKNLFIVLPSAREDKESLANEIRQTARESNSTVMIFYSERLSEMNFIVCSKVK